MRTICSRLMKLCACSTLSHQFSLHQLSYIAMDSSQTGPSVSVRKMLAVKKNKN